MNHDTSTKTPVPTTGGQTDDADCFTLPSNGWTENE